MGLDLGCKLLYSMCEHCNYVFSYSILFALGELLKRFSFKMLYWRVVYRISMTGLSGLQQSPKGNILKQMVSWLGVCQSLLLFSTPSTELSEH